MTGPDPLDAAAELDGVADLIDLDELVALADVMDCYRARYAGDDENRADLDDLADLDGTDLDGLDPDDPGPDPDGFDPLPPVTVYVAPCCGFVLTPADTWHACDTGAASLEWLADDDATLWDSPAPALEWLDPVGEW